MAVATPVTAKIPTGILAARQGDDWVSPVITIKLDGVAVDLSGGTLACQIKTAVAPAGVLVETPAIDTTDAALGQIQFLLTNAETALIEPGVYVLDVQHTLAGVVITYAEGDFTLTAQITV